ncbi:hypothetical protein [Bradymonas sediminis]|nr:hypothetical protein [Bradymonas sediminis]TDP72061.1 hypothetical protein DFR33_10741 [Bradymonas sediminis]
MSMTTGAAVKKYLLGGLLFSLLLACSAGSAVAQEPASGENAKAYYNKGVEAFFNKNYSLAITYFQRANALDPDPVVLYNISLAQSRLGNAPEALSASLKADAMGGLPDDTSLKNRARIRAYQRVVGAQKIAGAKAKADQALAKSVKAPQAGGAGVPPGSEAGMGALGWAGVGAASVGAAALVGTGVLNFMLSEDLDNYEKARTAGEYERALDLQNTIESRQSLGQIMLYSGAGLVALGGALWAVDYFGSAEVQESADASLKPALSGSVGPDGARVGALWRF